MITVMLYYQTGCKVCETIEMDLKALQETFPHHVVKVDIETDPSLKSRYEKNVPFLQIGPFRLQYPFNRQDIAVALGAASDRHKALTELGDTRYRNQLNKGHTLTLTDRFALWISKNYMHLFNLLFLLYVGLPFMAPVFAKSGMMLPAKVIYTVYSPLCHQLAYRSWFLFGEQPFYPRELAHIPDVITYEDLTNNSPLDLQAARKFIGNENVGYKVALCERDVAIYGAMLLFGILFNITGRKIKPAPWYLWLIIGLVPIGLDGVSQLTSIVQGLFPALAIYRESTPFLRTLTGGLFGLMTAWYIYPLIEEAVAENRRMILQKMAVALQIPTEQAQ